MKIDKNDRKNIKLHENTLKKFLKRQKHAKIRLKTHEDDENTQKRDEKHEIIPRKKFKTPENDVKHPKMRRKKLKTSKNQ